LSLGAAWVQVAWTLLGGDVARLATGVGDLSGTGVSSTTALLGAVSPLGPWSVDAAWWVLTLANTWVQVALSVDLASRAVSWILSLSEGSGSALLTTATVSSAGCPTVPSSIGAVAWLIGVDTWAGVNVAESVLPLIWAVSVVTLLDNTGSVMGTSTTWLVATRPWSPWSICATGVLGAWVEVAQTLHVLGWTLLASSGGSVTAHQTTITGSAAW